MSHSGLVIQVTCYIRFTYWYTEILPRMRINDDDDDDDGDEMLRMC